MPAGPAAAPPASPAAAAASVVVRVCLDSMLLPDVPSDRQIGTERERQVGSQPARPAGTETHRCSRMKTQSWAAEQVRGGLAGGRSAHRVALPHASLQVHAQAGRLNGLVRACGRWKHQCQARQMPCNRTGPYFVHMGVSKNRGSQYSTLNSRILIIRTPK